jgi:hypothetical protein
MALFAVVLALCFGGDAFVAASLTMLPLLPRLGVSGRRPGCRRQAVGDARRAVRPTVRAAFGRRRSWSPPVVATVVGLVVLGGAR